MRGLPVQLLSWCFQGPCVCHAVGRRLHGHGRVYRVRTRKHGLVWRCCKEWVVCGWTDPVLFWERGESSHAPGWALLARSPRMCSGFSVCVCVCACVCAFLPGKPVCGLHVLLKNFLKPSPKFSARPFNFDLFLLKKCNENVFQINTLFFTRVLEWSFK